jgi:hypothetical protein
MPPAPMNEAVRRENCAEKTLIQKKNNPCDLGGHERCKGRFIIKEA